MNYFCLTSLHKTSMTSIIFELKTSTPSASYIGGFSLQTVLSVLLIVKMALAILAGIHMNFITKIVWCVYGFIMFGCRQKGKGYLGGPSDHIMHGVDMLLIFSAKIIRRSSTWYISLLQLLTDPNM